MSRYMVEIGHDVKICKVFPLLAASQSAIEGAGFDSDSD